MVVSRTSLAGLMAMAVAAGAVAATGAIASAASNACDLVSVAEASAAMGTPSQPGVQKARRHGTSCRFYSADHQMNVFVQTVQPGDMVGAAQLGGKGVPGVGDKAIWASGSMFVQMRGKVAQIGLYRNEGSMRQMDPQLVTLAKAAVGRM